MISAIVTKEPGRRAQRNFQMLARISRAVLLSVCFFSMGGIVYSVDPSAEELNIAEKWFGNSLGESGPFPFSFDLDGQSSTNFLANWMRSETNRIVEVHCRERTTTFVNAGTGLEVRAVAKLYDDFPVVEWTLYFKNIGYSRILVAKEGMEGGII